MTQKVDRGETPQTTAPACSQLRWLACHRIGQFGACIELRGDLGQRRQSRHAVLRDALALAARVFPQLVVAIEIATVRPSLPDQLGLARILLRSAA